MIYKPRGKKTHQKWERSQLRTKHTSVHHDMFKNLKTRNGVRLAGAGKATNITTGACVTVFGEGEIQCDNRGGKREKVGGRGELNERESNGRLRGIQIFHLSRWTRRFRIRQSDLTALGGSVSLRPGKWWEDDREGKKSQWERRKNEKKREKYQSK